MFRVRFRQAKRKSEKCSDSKEFFLINSGDSQVFVTVTDEFIESRRLSRKITDKKFGIGGFLFTDCGVMKQ